MKSNAQSFEMETSKVKTLYENELGEKNIFLPFRVFSQEILSVLDEAKKLIEELAHEKSRLEIELEKSRSETQDVQTKFVFRRLKRKF